MARDARDRAAEAVNAAIVSLGPLVFGDQVTPAESVRRMATALHSLHMIARLMESVGAPTRPV
jgi:hypothetical protein